MRQLVLVCDFKGNMAKLGTNINRICWFLDLQIAPRAAYGKALVKLGASDDRIVALDGDMRGSTFSDMFRKKYPERFVEGFIAEQNIVGVAVGCGCRERTVPFLSTYAAFLTRAFDQVRMAAISQANVKFVGSHAGISVGMFLLHLF